MAGARVVKHLSTDELLHYCSLEAQGRLNEDSSYVHLESCQSCYDEMLLLQLSRFHEQQTEMLSEQSIKACRRIENHLTEVLAEVKKTVKSQQTQGGSYTGSSTGPFQMFKRPAVRAGLLAAAALVIAIIYWPARTIQQSPAPAFITMKTGRVELNNKPARVGQQVGKNDVIQTYKQSSATVQFGNAALVVLDKNTKVILSDYSVEDNQDRPMPVINLFQSSGSSYHRVNKGKAAYRVRTPLAIAAVRGTEFTVSAARNGEGQTIALIEGTVELKTAGQQSSLHMLEQGNKVTVDQAGFNESRLDQSDRKLFVNLGKVKQVDFDLDSINNSSNRTFNQQKIAALSRQIQETRQVVEFPFQPGQATSKPGLSLGQIKAKYGKLSRIILKNGKTLTGAFQMQGSSVIVITVKGKVKVNAADIKQFEPYP